MRSLAAKLESIDTRIMYTVLIVLIAIPLIKPLGLPVSLTADTLAAFRTIEALPDGTLVVLASGIKPPAAPEQQPITLSVLNQLIGKRIKIVFLPSMPEACQFIEGYAGICKERGYKEGVDFIVLPFVAGEESRYAAIGSDLKSLYKQQPSSPLWDSISSIKSVALWVDIHGGEQQRWAMAHIGGPHGIPIVVGVNASIEPSIIQYFASGQLAGIIGGLNGAAQYETLTKLPGKAAAGMDAQALGHMWIIFLTILGNIGFLISKRSGGGGKRAFTGGSHQ
jgi:hypothetical protein